MLKIIPLRKTQVWLQKVAYSLGDFFKDLLYPKFCVVCNKYGDFVCCDCFAAIETCRTSLCFFCGRISSKGKVCANCKSRHKFKLSAIVWASSYSDNCVKEMIHNHKYNGVMEIGDLLSEMLIQRLMAWNKINNLIVVPVPLHKSKYSKRGFNQAEIIARNVSERFGLKGGLALTRERETMTQVGLDRTHREKNLMGAFSCVDAELVNGKDVLLIDDVATTGTTLNECASALKAAGAKQVYGAVVARG